MNNTNCFDKSNRRATSRSSNFVAFDLSHATKMPVEATCRFDFAAGVDAG